MKRKRDKLTKEREWAGGRKRKWLWESKEKQLSKSFEIMNAKIKLKRTKEKFSIDPNGKEKLEGIHL